MLHPRRCLRGNHHQFLHLRWLFLAQVAGRPIRAAAMADQHDAAGVVLLGKGHRSIQAGENALGIGRVGLLAGLFGVSALCGVGIGCGSLGDVGIGIGRHVLGRGAFALVWLRLGSRLGLDPRLRAVGEQVGQAHAQAVPADIGKLLPQRTDRVWPVSRFASPREDDDRTLRVAVVGRFPQGQEAVGTGLQGLLFGLGHQPLQRLGVLLAALQQRRARGLGSGCLGGGGWFFGIGGQGAEWKDRGQAAHCQRRAIKCGHESTRGQNDTGSLIVFARDGHAAWPPLPRRACR
ncbi:hypothetical protein D3C79_748890 [compost metagenome]